MALGNPPVPWSSKNLLQMGTSHLKLSGYQVKTRKNTMNHHESAYKNPMEIHHGWFNSAQRSHGFESRLPKLGKVSSHLILHPLAPAGTSWHRRWSWLKLHQVFSQRKKGDLSGGFLSQAWGFYEHQHAENMGSWDLPPKTRMNSTTKSTMEVWGSSAI